MSQLPPDLRALEEHYELVRELGGTNATVVYLAHVRASGRLVALKTIRHPMAGDAEAAARFTREARMMASLDHPNIVRTLAVEQVGERTIALVMEYLEGGTLREMLRLRGQLEFDRARRVLSDVAQALEYAHARGIIHRDVKPENIFIEATTGRAMLSDFGIARLVEGDSNLTMAGSTVGTPTYMSPEQIDGGTVDARSDVYSLGVLGWELVSGRRPWDGETLYGVIYRQKHEDLASLSIIRPDTPVSLRESIEGAMRKDPAERWRSAQAFLDRMNDVDADGATAEMPTAFVEDLPTLRFAVPPKVPEPRKTQPIEREVVLASSPLVEAPPVEAQESVPPAPVVEKSGGMRRNPLWVAVPAAVALGAAVLVFASREQANHRRDVATFQDSLVSMASGGNVAPAITSRGGTTTTRSKGKASELANPATPVTSPRARAIARRDSLRAIQDSIRAARLRQAPVGRSRDVAVASASPVEQTASAATSNRGTLLQRIAENDVQLNRVYQELIAALRSRDAGAVDELRSQQRAWINERDEACRDGSDDERAACFREQTNRRVEELRARLTEVRGMSRSTTRRRSPPGSVSSSRTVATASMSQQASGRTASGDRMSRGAKLRRWLHARFKIR